MDGYVSVSHIVTLLIHIYFSLFKQSFKVIEKIKQLINSVVNIYFKVILQLLTVIGHWKKWATFQVGFEKASERSSSLNSPSKTLEIGQRSVSSAANTGRQCNSLGTALNQFSCKLGLVDQTTWSKAKIAYVQMEESQLNQLYCVKESKYFCLGSQPASLLCAASHFSRLKAF